MRALDYSVEDHIARALDRCGSSVTVREVLAALFSGRLRLWLGRHMSSSAWILPGGAAEIVHLAGRWDTDEAKWMLAGFEAFALEYEAPIVWNGRRGWHRFLKWKGVI
jgi:hypothetical protein